MLNCTASFRHLLTLIGTSGSKRRFLVILFQFGTDYRELLQTSSIFPMIVEMIQHFFTVSYDIEVSL